MQKANASNCNGITQRLGKDSCMKTHRTVIGYYRPAFLNLVSRCKGFQLQMAAEFWELYTTGGTNLEKTDVQIFTSFRNRLMIFLRTMQFLMLLKCWHFKAPRDEQILDSFQVWEKSREILKGLSCTLLQEGLAYLSEVFNLTVIWKSILWIITSPFNQTDGKADISSIQGINKKCNISLVRSA